MVDMVRRMVRRSKPRPGRRPAGRAGRQDERAGRQDYGPAALALPTAVMLRKTIELAGAVRDLVYHSLTEGQAVVGSTRSLFGAAMDAVPDPPDDVGAGFARAYKAASSLPDPAAGPIQEIVRDEVEKTLNRLGYWGVNQAAADAFAAAFPREADALAETSPGRAGGGTWTPTLLESELLSLSADPINSRPRHP